MHSMSSSSSSTSKSGKGEKQKKKGSTESWETLKIDNSIEKDDGDNSSDSDQDEKGASNKKYELDLTHPENPLDKQKTKIIEQINLQIKNGEKVDLASYPKLFLVHFRGVHFLHQFFDKNMRRDERKKIYNEVEENVYSPAVYELAGLKVGEPINTREKAIKIISAKKTIMERFFRLEESKSERMWWGVKKSEFDNGLYEHYQRFANTYEEFRDESKNRGHKCYQVMDCDRNPYISTADGAKHAASYALGGKAELVQGRLNPAYLSTKRAKHPKIGYVQIIFHEIASFKKYNPLLLSALHAESKISIKGRNLNERETTFKGYLSKKHVVKKRVLRFPSFNKNYSGYYRQKYGIDNRSYTRYQNAFGEGGTGLLKALAEHYANVLLIDAEKEAAKRGGIIVYLGLDGQLKSALPPTSEISEERKQKNTAPSFVHNLSLYSNSKVVDSDDEEELKQFLKPEEKSVSFEKIVMEELAKQFVEYLNGLSKKNNDFDHIADQKPLEGVFNNKTIFFEEYEALGDGSCGFHVLGASRKDLVQLLSAEKTNLKSRQFLAPEIRAYYVENSLSNAPQLACREAKLEAELKKLREDCNCTKKWPENCETPAARADWLLEQSEIKGIHFIYRRRDLRELKKSWQDENEKLNKLCQSEQTYQQYVGLYITNNLWLGYITALLYAKKKHFNLYIWHKDEKDKTKLKLDNVNKDEEKGSPAVIHMLHKNGFTHFSLLVQKMLHVREESVAHITSGIDKINIDDDSLDKSKCGQSEIPPVSHLNISSSTTMFSSYASSVTGSVSSSLSSFSSSSAQTLPPGSSNPISVSLMSSHSMASASSSSSMSSSSSAFFFAPSDSSIAISSLSSPSNTLSTASVFATPVLSDIDRMAPRYKELYKQFCTTHAKNYSSSELQDSAAKAYADRECQQPT